MLNIFSLISGINFKYIKIFIIVGVTITAIIYIKMLRHTINSQQTTITEMHDKYVKDQLIWSINNKTLEISVAEQNNKIKQFQINEELSHKYFDNSLNTLKKEYWVKIQEAKDSNISQEVEYQAFKKFVREEIK